MRIPAALCRAWHNAEQTVRALAAEAVGRAPSTLPAWWPSVCNSQTLRLSCLWAEPRGLLQAHREPRQGWRKETHSVTVPVQGGWEAGGEVPGTGPGCLCGRPCGDCHHPPAERAPPSGPGPQPLRGLPARAHVLSSSSSWGRLGCRTPQRPLPRPPLAPAQA